MRKTILIMTILLVAATSGISLAASSSDQENIKTFIDPTYASPCLPQPNDKTEVNKRGCCSWHGGVCGCENGRAKCCDGTLSPTCGC
jgi:hypothetical protein